MKISFKRIS